MCCSSEGDGGGRVDDATLLARFTQWGEDLRATLFHMMKRIFRHSKDLENIASESTLYIIQVNILKVLTHELLPGIVHQDINLAIPINVFLDCVLAGIIVHEVSWEEQTLVAFFLDHALGLFGVFLFFWEVDDCYVCAFAGEEDCY